MLLAPLLIAASSALAQERRVDTLASGDPEAQVMGYYAAVMHFTPAGFPDRAARWEVGGEAAYLPSLSAEQQTVGFRGTKAENTNFCPVFPRLRAAAVRGDWALEAGYLPPLRVCGVKPHMVSAALSRRFRAGGAWDGALRGAVHYGVLNAPITCNEQAVADPTNAVCFQGQVSDDRFRPFTLALEAAAIFGGLGRRRIEPYLLVGLRRDDPRLDVHFVNAQDSLDNAREQLESALIRAHVAAGASWAATGRLVLGGELYYAPGALLTARARAGLALGRTQ
jgi:hypothetical protein